jgi:hypothetical protein
MATDMFDTLSRLTCLTTNPVKSHWTSGAGATDARVAFHLHRINATAQTRMGVVVSPDPINDMIKVACKHLRRSTRAIRVMPIGVYRDHVLHQLMLIIDGGSGFLFDPHGDFRDDAKCIVSMRRLIPNVYISRRVCGSSIGPQEVEEEAGVRGVTKHGTGHCAAWCLLLVELIARTGCDVQSAARAMMVDEDGVARTPTQMKRAISAYSQHLMLLERQSEFNALTDDEWLTNDL